MADDIPRPPCSSTSSVDGAALGALRGILLKQREVLEVWDQRRRPRVSFNAMITERSFDGFDTYSPLYQKDGPSRPGTRLRCSRFDSTAGLAAPSQAEQSSRRRRTPSPRRGWRRASESEAARSEAEPSEASAETEGSKIRRIDEGTEAVHVKVGRTEAGASACEAVP